MQLKICRNGNHSFEVIRREGNDLAEEVTKWCTICGSLVIDLEYDGRLKPGAIMPLRHPRLYVIAVTTFLGSVNDYV